MGNETFYGDGQKKKWGGEMSFIWSTLVAKSVESVHELLNIK